MLEAPIARLPHGLLIQAQVIGRGQQLKAELYRNVHVGHVFAVSVTIPVVEVLDHFVEHHSAVGSQSASSDTMWNHDSRHFQGGFFLGRFKCSCNISQTSEHTLPRQISPGEMAAFCQVMLVNFRHPTQTIHRCAMNILPHLLEHASGVLGLDELTCTNM